MTTFLPLDTRNMLHAHVAKLRAYGSLALADAVFSTPVGPSMDSRVEVISNRIGALAANIEDIRANIVAFEAYLKDARQRIAALGATLADRIDTVYRGATRSIEALTKRLDDLERRLRGDA